MWGDDAEKIRRYQRLFAEAVQRDFVEIESALANGDIASLRYVAHRTKTSAATLGANGIAQLCHTLENVGDDIGEARMVVEKMRVSWAQVTAYIKDVLP